MTELGILRAAQRKAEKVKAAHDWGLLSRDKFDRSVVCKMAEKGIQVDAPIEVIAAAMPKMGRVICMRIVERMLARRAK